MQQFQWWERGRKLPTPLFPSRVSGRGYKIGPVYVCVCVSVCQRSHGWTIWATDLKFGVNIAFDNILDEIRGQGQRSKVKVAILKKRDFRTFCSETCLDCRELLCHDIWRHVTSRRDVMCRDVVMLRDVTAWHPFTSGQEYLLHRWYTRKITVRSTFCLE